MHICATLSMVCTCFLNTHTHTHTHTLESPVFFHYLPPRATTRIFFLLHVCLTRFCFHHATLPTLFYRYNKICAKRTNYYCNQKNMHICVHATLSILLYLLLFYYHRPRALLCLFDKKKQNNTFAFTTQHCPYFCTATTKFVKTHIFIVEVIKIILHICVHATLSILLYLPPAFLLPPTDRARARQPNSC